MKKLLIGFLVLLILTATAAFIFYKFYLPEIVADALIQEGETTPLPDFVEEKIEKFRKPVNENADEVIAQMHDMEIPLSKVISGIDNLNHTSVNATIAEIHRTHPSSTDEVFDILKRNLNPDIEPFRKVFNKKVSMKMIKQRIADYESHNFSETDFELSKEVAKEILVKKDAAFVKNHPQP